MDKTKSFSAFLLLSAVLLILFIVSLFFGRYPVPGFLSINRLIEDPLAMRLFLNLRLPRIITALLLGTTLAASGTVLQMLFGNPLVEPGFLGISQGAAFGAALSIIYFSSQLHIVQITASLFAGIGLLLSYIIARKIRFGGWVLRLILSGITISALFTAGIGLLKYLSDPLSELPEITFWMLGGLWGTTWKELLYIAPVTILSLLVMYRMRWRLTLLSLSDESSFSLGVFPAKERVILLVAAATATAAVVSVSGIVGWVGLLVPNAARRIFGADARFTLPGSILIGGIFVIFCDNISRTLLPGEIPLGIITSFFGTVFFTILLVRKKMGLIR